MKKKILLGIIIFSSIILIVYGAICIKRQIDIKNENNEIKKESKILVVFNLAKEVYKDE